MASTRIETGSDAGTPAWRESAVKVTLSVAAIVVPPLVAVALLLRSTLVSRTDVVVLVSFGILLPLLRFAPRWSITLRGAIGIASAFAVSVYLIARGGLGAGVSAALATTCSLAVVYRGRWLGYLLAGAAAVAAITVGLLVTSGELRIEIGELDPLRMKNWVRIAVTGALLNGLLVTVIDFVIRQVEASSRATTAALDELRVAYDQLGQLHGRLEAAKEEERRFIAHELHDELGQNLTALKLRLRPTTEAPRDGNAASLDLIDQLITQVRKLSGDLRPPLLDEVGLIPALRAYLQKQAALTNVAIDLEVTEPAAPERLAPDLEIACFRVIQESLTNALRHAAPRRVRVTVRRDREQIVLTVKDDGAGFDTAATVDAAAARGHLGVVGMRERVRTRGGTFRLASSPGGGTTVQADLPIAIAPAPASRPGGGGL